MRKQYTNQLTLAILLCSSAAFAQNELKGKITDAITGISLGAISIFIPDLNRGGITDTSGNFKIEHLPSGQYSVLASAVGFSSQIFSVSINLITVKNLSFQHSSASLKAVVVTGVLNAQDNRNVPFPVSTFSHQDLMEESYTNVIDAISKIPGVSAITDGQSIAKPVIRGMGYNRVVTIDNGMLTSGVW